MTNADARTLHADEIATDAALVRGLLRAQFPRWAGLDIAAVGAGGTSNAMYRLGADMVVRLPRIAGAVGDVEKEQRWLPRLAGGLPVAVPVPLGNGVPAPALGYPWPWSVYGWLAGETVGPGVRCAGLAVDLAGFAAALHRVDPAGAPAAYRSEALSSRDGATRATLRELGGLGEVDADAAGEVWDAALSVPGWEGAPVWIHADLQPGNVLVAHGRLSAVIDFGCAGLGDPAVDLLAGWYCLTAAGRGRFRSALAELAGPEASDSAWARGRGWALSVAAAELSYYRGRDSRMTSAARGVLAALTVSP